MNKYIKKVIFVGVYFEMKSNLNGWNLKEENEHDMEMGLKKWKIFFCDFFWIAADIAIDSNWNSAWAL